MFRFQGFGVLAFGGLGRAACRGSTISNAWLVIMVAAEGG